MDVYLDHAAATPLDPGVLEKMMPYLREDFGNPSSFHSVGKRATDDLVEAREEIAGILSCRADELIFTSCGTESDNLAILGFARANAAHGKHIITSRAEHQAVLEACEQLEKEGFEVTYLSPDRFGQVSAASVAEALRDNTLLVSIMYANNEIGTINPISEIGVMVREAREKNKRATPMFHTDACQAGNYLSLDIQKLNVDLLTVNGSKVYGPKGIGLLYVKRGVKLQPLMFGGPQEKRLRPGTQHMAGITGLSHALTLAQADREKETVRLLPLREGLIRGILETIPKTRLNGHPTDRLPNNVNISFMDIEGEALVLYLDAAGISVATGSACTSASLDPSHVILSLGLPFEAAHGSIRFSLGRSTTQEGIDYVLKTLPALVAKLRSISPVNVDEKFYQ